VADRSGLVVAQGRISEAERRAEKLVASLCSRALRLR
jgi:hypothetical protein